MENTTQIKIKNCTKCKIPKEYFEFTNKSDTKDKKHEQCKSCLREYYLNNKERINKYSRENNKKYYPKNKENALKYQRKYYKKNKKKQIKKGIERKKKRYKNDIQYRLKMVLSVRFNYLLRRKKVYKKCRVYELLGCDLEFFKNHISSKFLPEMNFDNYAKIWEIDHIKPCSSFNLEDIEQQKQCFHYTNTQPLFITTKIAKSFGYTDQIGNRNKNKY